MIFVAAGTQDGRELAGFLLARGYAVTASVVSSYGEELLRRYKGIQINDKPLDAEGMLDYIKEHGIKCFIDASHPYAANVSVNAMQACHIAGIPYLRYERQESRLEYDRAFYVSSYAEAAEKASELGKNIFLTTGSRNLKAFAGAGCLKDCRIVCRVLPDPEVLTECAGLGFTPDNIIAMQGPFSELLNQELFKKYEAEVVVTKNSGSIGGTDTKFSAAMKLNLPLIIIDRPHIEYDEVAGSFEEAAAFAEKYKGV